MTKDDELRIYIVFRKDVGERLSKAKFGVQCAHAAMAVFVSCFMRDRNRAMKYLIEGQTKIVLQVKDDRELLALHLRALALGFYSEKITDAGRTELPEPTLTSIAIGPIWYQTEGEFLKRVRLYTENPISNKG